MGGCSMNFIVPIHLIDIGTIFLITNLVLTPDAQPVDNTIEECISSTTLSS